MASGTEGFILPQRLDNRDIFANLSEVRLFACVRNEALRIPYFLKYYSARGVSRFFVIDNCSTDNTAELLLESPITHVFRASGSYSQAGSGISWIRYLLDSYGRGHWCIVADADEILVYPNWEYIAFPDLCAYLTDEGASALHSILVDMYSESAFSETLYESGTDLLHICPYYESASIVCVATLRERQAGAWRHYGGMRLRVFGLNVRLDKVNLFRYDPGIQLVGGMHSISGAPHSRLQGAVLHFKYLMDFTPRVAVEAQRAEHWFQAAEYKRYHAVTREAPSIGAFTPDSQRFRQSSDLLRCHIMESSLEFDRLVHSDDSPRTKELV